VEYGLKMDFDPVSKEGMGFCFYGSNPKRLLRGNENKKGMKQWNLELAEKHRLDGQISAFGV
jgi:hypothetical protein